MSDSGLTSESEEEKRSSGSEPGPSPLRILQRYFESEKVQSSLLWFSRACLLGLLAAYLLAWTKGNWGMLTDPYLQNDDARTILFPFHRYGAADSLAGDPIADEMLSLVPWGVRALYLLFVPIVDVFVASKLVQGVALGILLWAAAVLSRSRRTGLAAGALLLFMMLHTPFAVDRIGGGLPRAFGFPCFALWLSGVLAGKRLPRFLAPVLLALSYPSIMNLILAAEGFLAIRGLGRISWSVIGHRLRRYLMLVGVCLACVLPAALGDSDRGPIHTLEQAKKEPAFGRSGRLWILPFAKPLASMSQAFMSPLKPRSDKEFPLPKIVKKEREIVAALLVSLFLLIAFLRWVPPPSVAVSFLVGAVIIYGASRVFAFRLYSPERYYSFGMRMACLTLVMACTAHIWYWVRFRFRESARNLTAAFLIASLWLLTGSGIVRDSGMEIRRSTNQKLYEFIRTLPKDVRFASHIRDGDGIPFWGARATMGAFETLQPWFVGSWARQKKRAMDTIDALYATDQEAVLSYAEKNHVSHFLLKRGRYRKKIARHARSFEPFSSYAKIKVGRKKEKDFVLARPPKEAILFKSGPFQVVGVKELRAAWARE